MTAKGYVLSKRNIGKTSVCKECSNKIPLRTNNSDLDEISSGNLGTYHCIICEKDITNSGRQKQIDYPNEIAVLFDVTFENRGDRFWGVNSTIKSTGTNEKEYASGAAKKVDGNITKHSPVVFEIKSESLKSDIKSMIETLQRSGRLRGIMNQIDTDDDNPTIYEFKIFAKF